MIASLGGVAITHDLVEKIYIHFNKESQEYCIMIRETGRIPEKVASFIERSDANREFINLYGQLNSAKGFVNRKFEGEL